ncbi:MAG: hypothetical protein ABI388_10285, partial [Bacteroidia bacterium]
MKKFLKIVLFSTLINFLCSCHKYPNDTFISLESPFDRLTGNQGVWQLTSFKVNGEDSTNNYIYSFLGQNVLPSVGFATSKEVNNYSVNGANDIGPWELINGDKQLELDNVTPSIYSGSLPQKYLFPAAFWDI